MNDISPDRRSAPDLFADGGATGSLLRVLDWSRSPLGEPAAWPPQLHTLVDVMLQSRQPMFVVWGPSRTLLYNDAYALILAGRHPEALGADFAEVWADIWEVIAPILDRAYAGESTSMDDIELHMQRFGRVEETHFAFSYTPVRGEDGRVAGMFCACTETTAQVMADRRLRESEEQNRAIVEGARDYAIFTADLAGVITSWSPGAEAVFGWPAEEAVGRRTELVFTPEDRGAGVPDGELAEAAREGCANDERWHVRRDGSRVFMNGSARPLHDAKGEPRGFIKVARDETERRRQVEQLAESEHRFRQMADAAPVILWVTDPDGVCTYLNEPWYDLTGQTPDEAEGFGWLDATHPDDKERAGQVFRDANARRAPFYVEYRLRRADGSYIWAIDLATPRFGPDGAYLGYVGSVIDISHRKAAEDAQAESEARFRTLTDAIPAFVWFADPDGAVTYYNARWYAYTGLTEAQSTGAGWADALHPDDVAATSAAWEEARARGYSYVVECRYRRVDGAYRWYVVRAEPLRDENNRITGWFGTSTDIHDRKEAETALRESEEHYRHSVELNPQVAWTAGPDGQLDRVAQRWMDWTGSSGLGETWGEAIHPDDLQPSIDAWTRSVTTGSPYDIEHRVRLRSGEHHWMRSRALPRRDASGAILRWYGNTEDIHDTKQAEAALAASEQRFRDIADSIDQMIWSTRPDGFHDYFNRRWYEYTGVPEGSTDGEGWAGMFHPDDQPRTWERWTRSLETGEPYHVEYRLRRADGEWRWVLGRARPVRDENGRITRWYGTCTDIHEQKMTEARLASIMDAVPVGILMAEAPSGRLVESNRFMETLLRRPVRKAGDAPDYAAREAYSGDGRRIADGEWPIQRVLASGEPAEAEVRFRRGDNSLGWLRIQAAPVRDAAGETVGAVAGVTDVEEIVQAREVLARSRQELEQEAARLAAERDRLWALSEDLLVVADYSGRLLRVNPSWTRVLGFDEATLLSRPYADILHPDELEFIDYNLTEMRATGRPVRFENRVLAADGDWRWISWRLSPEEDGERLYGSGRDITAEKRQGETLARIEEQLRQAQKMEAVGQLTGGVAHDFNNLLQIVVGNLELLNRSLPADAARQRRSVENAMSGAKRAVTLTQRLLAFSRRQPLAPKPVSVNKLVSGMSELLARALGETIEVETVLAAGLWQVEVDPNQLENAILNLAVNARDAMPDGGKLTIETANTRLDESYVQQNVEVAPGQYVVICVSDTGVGMDRDVAARVFEPFFTTKEVGKGTGLGLSQVYGFVKQSGGHVKIYSERGGADSRGTTVKIYLPRYLGDAAEEAHSEEAAAPGADQAEIVLVVEDDPDVRAYTVEVLRELGYGVLEAGDAHQALRLLRDGAVHCDLLFTDVVLPGGMNGEQLAAAAHEARPGLKVLFTTGYARNAIVHHGRLDPGVRLITKPFTYADLAARVRDVLDEGAAPAARA